MINQNQGPVTKYDLTVFIRLVPGLVPASKAVVILSIPAVLQAKPSMPLIELCQAPLDRSCSI